MEWSNSLGTLKYLSIFLIRKISQLLSLNSNFINRRFIILTNIRILGFKFLFI
jgi:hypothetical protein